MRGLETRVEGEVRSLQLKIGRPKEFLGLMILRSLYLVLLADLSMILSVRSGNRIDQTTNTRLVQFTVAQSRFYIYKTNHLHTQNREQI